MRSLVAVVVVSWLSGCNDGNADRRKNHCARVDGYDFVFCGSKRECENTSTRCFTPDEVWCHQWEGYDDKKHKAVALWTCLADRADCEKNFALPRSAPTLKDCTRFSAREAPLQD